MKHKNGADLTSYVPERDPGETFLQTYFLGKLQYLVVVWWKVMGWVMGSLPTARRRSARPLARRRTTYPIVYINKRSKLHFEVARNLNGNTTAAAEDAYFVVRVEHLEFSGTAYWEVKLRIVSES